MAHHPIDSAIAFILLVGIVSGSFVYVFSARTPEGYIGISGTELTPAIAQQMHLSSASGFLIIKVEQSSPAEKAGIKGGNIDAQIGGRPVKIGGDVIVAVDGHTIQGTSDLISDLKDKNIGDKIDFTVLRAGNSTADLTVTVEPKPNSLFQ